MAPPRRGSSQQQQQLPSRRLLTFAALALLAHGVAAQQRTPPNNPSSPAKTTCPRSDGSVYEIGGYPSSPYVITPFADEYRDPVEGQVAGKACRADGHCVRAYHVTVAEGSVRPFDNAIAGCRSQPNTTVLMYNGTIPGPTIRAPAGHEVLVRFTNNIVPNSAYPTYAPCNGGRSGRPISIHYHGSASLAPYDGWADDETCYGESKDYVYPLNRPGTGWYHDHAVHITARNAYAGLSAMFIASSKVRDGGCGEPWNLENIPESSLMIGDRLLNRQCQLHVDPKEHEDDIYGDVNLVNGIPFPNMKLAPVWHRFRLCNVAASRPYFLKIKAADGKTDIHNRCYVIAADGGFRDKYVPFPRGGLMLGVAERYELACDFSGLAGQWAFLYNDVGGAASKVMKDVPAFCHSHLIARLDFSLPAPANPARFEGGAPKLPAAQPNPLAVPPGVAPPRPLLRVLNQTVIDAAVAMAARNQFHRNFQFGKSSDEWVINGETWMSKKIAASDVGHNTWEVWRFETGGGWFHPIHMHLVDFYVLKRVTSNPIPSTSDTSFNKWPGVRDQEYMAPKDVVYLGPSETIYVLVRFGAHQGDYMFHCHNLVHEDNDMMRAFSVVNTTRGAFNRNSALFVPNPLYKLVYGNYYALGNPMAVAPQPSGQLPPLNWDYLKNDVLPNNYYAIFYPNATNKATYAGLTNPWETDFCV